MVTCHTVKNFFLIILLTSVVLSGSMVGVIKKAHAQVVPVIDNANLAANTASAAEQGSLTLKENVTDAIAWVIAKQAIGLMTESLVNWINSGFEGSPAFVENPDELFGQVADAAFSEFISGSAFDFVCEPFGDTLRQALSLRYSRGRYNFNSRINCTIDDVIGNVNDFGEALSDNFSENGGWGSFLTISQTQNNPTGAFLLAHAEMETRISAAQGTQALTLGWNQGFLSVTDEDGNIQTPGQLIETQLSDNLGSGVRQLELADELNEIVGALTGQLVQQGLQGGLSSLSDSSGGGGSSYVSGLANEDVQSDFSEPPEAEGPDIPETPEGTQNPNLALRSEYTAGSSQVGDRRAELAVDGNTSGVADESGFGSVFVTDVEDNPWWQIDLREEQAIGDIHIYPQTGFRTDNGNLDNVSPEEALGTFKIFISNTQFPSNFDPEDPAIPLVFEGERRLNSSGKIIIDAFKEGQYVRIQRVDGNKRLRMAEVKIFRNPPPEITLNGDDPQEVEVGETYIDPGATATDQSDKRLQGSESVVVTSDVREVNTSEPGRYEVIYTAVDSGGAKATKTRTVQVTEPEN